MSRLYTAQAANRPWGGGSGGLDMFAPGVDLSWQDEALCAETDPGTFYPEQSDAAAARRAKAICGHCPVITECLEYALGTGEEYGVWGGLSERERRKLIRTAPPVSRLATAEMCGRGRHVLPPTNGPRRRCSACRRETDRLRTAERKAEERAAQTGTEAA